MDVRALLSFGLNNKGTHLCVTKMCSSGDFLRIAAHKEPSLLSPPFARGAADKDTGSGR